MLMSRYAQLYYGEIIFIYETDKTMEELNQIFDPSTGWFDITNTPDVQIGYVQGIIDGKMLLVPKESPYSLNNIQKEIEEKEKANVYIYERL